MCHLYPAVSNLELVFPVKLWNSLIWCLFNDSEVPLPLPSATCLNLMSVCCSTTLEALFLNKAIPLNPLILQYLAPILFSFFFSQPDID